MSLDTVRLTPEGGIILNEGERVAYSQKDVKLTFKKAGKDFKDVDGIAYISSQRIVFAATNPKKFQTIDMPRRCIKDLNVEQPVFGSNYISLRLEPEVNGGLDRTEEVKMDFKAGGAINFAKAANVSFRQAAINTGIVPQQQGHGPAMPQEAGKVGPGHAPPVYAQQGGPQGYPPQQQGYPPQQQGYPPQQQGYPPQQQGYPPQQQGYPPQQQGPPPQQSYPPQQYGYPPQANGPSPQGYAPPMSYDQTQAGAGSSGGAPPGYGIANENKGK